MKETIIKISELPTSEQAFEEIKRLAEFLKKERIEKRFRGKKVFFYLLNYKYKKEVMNSRINILEPLGGIERNLYEANKKHINNLIKERNKQDLKEFLNTLQEKHKDNN